MNHRFTFLLIITNLISLIVTVVFIVCVWKFGFWKPFDDSTEETGGQFRRLQNECCSCTYNLEGKQGALITTDCQFRDYAYAIDIFLSCGSERFNDHLRLHTFKRHSRGHRKVFNDQLLTFRQGRLWFDAYTTPRCIQVRNNGNLHLVSSSASSCTEIAFVPTTTTDGYFIKDTSTDLCVRLGSDATCDSDRSTGGEECRGIDHRYLSLGMGSCEEEALIFRFETEAQDCSNNANELPSSRCFIE